MSIVDSLRPNPDLRVLVTAGGGGIGAAIARAFHAAGSRVHVCDVDRSALDRLTSETRGITGSMADAAVAADVERVFDDVRSALGGLDVLISSASSAGPSGPIETIEGHGWERTIAVNLHSQFYFARRAAPLLKQSLAGPCLITLGAGASSVPGHNVASASSQWAIVGLMKSLAAELWPFGIRVNAILPGEAERTRRAAPSVFEAKALGVDALSMPAGQGGEPVRRPATLDDVAALALFLCSPAARSLTGQVVGLGGHLDAR